MCGNIHKRFEVEALRLWSLNRFVVTKHQQPTFHTKLSLILEFRTKDKYYSYGFQVDSACTFPNTHCLILHIGRFSIVLN